jgi:ribosomal protein L16 Arg81 hydroxylase
MVKRSDIIGLNKKKQFVVSVDNSAFGELIWPIEVNRFFRDCWERHPLVLHRSASEYYLELFSLQDLDHIIASGQLRYPECKLVKDGKEIPTQQYASLANAPTGTIDIDALYSEYQNGATIIVNSAHRYWRTLSLLCNDLERCFHHPFQTNIYLTPRHSQGFAAHYDTHDVFILQIAGSKRWRIYESAIVLPDESQPYDGSLMRPGRLRLACTLNAGDMIYIPRGYIHKATAAENSALHLTLGLTVYTWSDVLLEAMGAVCREYPRFRQALPIGFAEQGKSMGLMKRKFSELIREFSDRAELEDTINRIVERFLNQRPRFLDGQLLELRRVGTLDRRSVVRKRATIIYRIQEEEDKISLVYHGKKIRFPRFVESTLRFIVKNGEFQIASIPGGLDDHSKLVLVRCLVREGFLTLVTPS